MPIVVFSSDTRTYRRVGWPFALWGAALVVFGLVLALAPRLTATLVVTMFGWACLVAGAFQLLSAVFAQRAFRGLAWIPVAAGILAVALGLVTLRWPEAVASVFAVLAGLAILAWGLADTGIGWTGRRYFITWQLHVIRGVLISAAGLIIVTRPIEALIAVAWVVGVLAVAVGTMTILMGVMARRIPDTT